MSDDQRPDNRPSQIEPSPVPTIIRVGTAGALVVLAVQTPVGTSTYFIDSTVVASLIEGLRSSAVTASTGLIVPTPKIPGVAG